jgi:uncharacterized protein with PIN domain
MRTPFSRMELFERNESRETEGEAKVLLTEKYERCAFCNSKLVFSHDLNINYLQVIETSRCPGCGVTMLPKKYTLQ